MVQLLGQIFSIIQKNDGGNFSKMDIKFKTLALEGTWIMANLCSGPNWVAERLLFENNQTTLIYTIIEQFLKSEDPQLLE